MPFKIKPIDVQQLITEVATRHDLLLKPGDPWVALVTMNSLLLEHSLETVHDEIRATIGEFDASVQKAEKRAGTMLAQEVKESSQQMRQGLQNDIRVAGVKSLEFVHAVNEANRRPARIRWCAVGLVAGAALFGSGVWVGTLLQ